MSWEGYYQCICPEGHYFTHDGYEDETCPSPGCGLRPVWDHQVDQTNGGEWDPNINDTVWPEEAIPCVISYDEDGRALIPTQIILDPAYKKMPDDFYEDSKEDILRAAIEDLGDRLERAKREIKLLEKSDTDTLILLGKYVKYSAYCKQCAKDGNRDPISFDDFESGKR